MQDIEDTPKNTSACTVRALRIAIIDRDKCKPPKCNQQCKRKCPVNGQGKKCVEVDRLSKFASIAESLCTGCNICTKVCPFGAIKIVNIPTNISKHIVHRYGNNAFKLHRLPVPRKNSVLGLVGSNGLGKSTILQILAGKISINLGRYDDAPTENEILKSFSGSELQDYLKHKKTTIIKPQYVDLIPKLIQKSSQDTVSSACGTTVFKYISKLSIVDGTANEQIDNVLNLYELSHLKDRDIGHLSGGELQRFACAYVHLSEKEVYMFDEPSSFLDIKQRLKVADNIRLLATNNRYVIVVEHDLSILDYLSDYVCVLYGSPTVYGVVSAPFTSRNGINVFLDGYIPTENMRFRTEPFTFTNLGQDDDKTDSCDIHTYPSIVKELHSGSGSFKLTIQQGTYSGSTITVLLGENGVGKTTFIKTILETNSTNSISYKPQDIKCPYSGTVRDFLGNSTVDDIFVSSVIKPLKIDTLYNNQVSKLSGGELQKVIIASCLSQNTDLYLFDEPSAYLDSESRIILSRILKRYFLNNKKPAFIVEHDILMATYLADKIILFEGIPGIETTASIPLSLDEGMNRFLQILDITLRKDMINSRPRINKKLSQKDTEQKKDKRYYVV